MPYDPLIFLNILFIGLFQGAIYSLIGMGLTLIFGTMKIVNFANGEFMMFAAYVVYWLWALLQLDPLISLMISFGLFFFIGYAVEKVVIDRVIARPTYSQMLITLGLALIIQNLVLMFWKADPRYVRPVYSELRLDYGSLAIPMPRLLSFIVALVFSLILHLFLQRTTYGTAIRGTGQDREAANLMGINVSRIYGLSFALGISCTSVAATLLTTYYPLTPYLGGSFMLMTFIVIVLGGLGNYVGAFISGLILGTIEIYTAFFLSPLLKQTVPLIIFILVLLLKPEGLFGKRSR